MEKANSKPLTLGSARQRLAWLGEGALALVLTYLLAAHALDTGSLQQYFLALVSLVFSINRFILTVRGNNHGKN